MIKQANDAQSEASTYNSCTDDSLTNILSIFESKKGVNTMKLSNKIMDSRPKFKKDKEKKKDIEAIFTSKPLKPNKTEEIYDGDDDRDFKESEQETKDRFLNEEELERDREERRRRNIEKVQQRLGEHIDFSKLTPEEVQEVKLKLLKIKKKEKQKKMAAKKKKK